MPTNTNSPLNEYLTKDELARELHRSTRTLDRWHTRRVGPTRTVAKNSSSIKKVTSPNGWSARPRTRSVRDIFDQPSTHEEKRRYAQHHSHAKSAAVDLETWRKNTLRRLRSDRNQLYLSENANSSVARTLLAETGGAGDDEAWAHIFDHVLDDHRADQVDRQIQQIESATATELITIRREMEMTV